MRTLKIVVMLTTVLLLAVSIEYFTPPSSAENHKAHDTNAQKRSQALWLYAEGKGAEAFTILDGALEDPDKMADFAIWLPLYHWTFVAYAEIGDEHFLSDKAKQFRKTIEDKKDKTEIDFIKLALINSIGQSEENFPNDLDELLKKFPNSSWKEWVEYQKIISQAWKSYNDRVRKSLDERTELPPNDTCVPIAKYAGEALKKNPNFYLRRLFLSDIARAKGSERARLEDAIETHIRNYATSVKGEEAKKILQSLVAELDKVRDIRETPSDYSLSLDPLADVRWNLRGAQPDEKKKIVTAFFLQRMSEGAGQNIPDDIKKIIIMPANP